MFELLTIPVIVAGTIIFLIIWAIMLASAWRVVVPTNLVHIVQSSRKTTSYGSVSSTGNAYYKIPSFVPIFGVTTIELPVNNFSIKLEGYEAYDKDRAPFDLDLIGFFRITDTNVAAARAASFPELEAQLKSVMQGAARTVLAKHDINDIMGERGMFGEQFTKEVDEGLKEWGVKTVKNLELMDIRDAKQSKIIHDIMAKKSSHIAMESRKVVADNNRQAELAEIEAKQMVDLRQQEQLQLVGQRTAEQEQQVGIAREKAQQEVQQAAYLTKTRIMAVERVETVQRAEIEAAAIAARAEGQRQAQVKTAEGTKEAMILQAEGTRAEGEAKGAAEKALLMAPVEAQIALADKIGKDEGYQDYLEKIRQIEANEKVGIYQADALKQAEIKILANSGTAAGGLTSIGEVISAKGGTNAMAALEAFMQSDAGKALIEKFIGGGK